MAVTIDVLSSLPPFLPKATKKTALPLSGEATTSDHYMGKAVDGLP
ncbi:hypothetical protein [Bifidobacterium angulatum]|uniref:Uncharacterized protein n=1 Tax=Bifidobacterium angulatum DSM 20098 = JCM 7096 TaxID=518635 RepID=C4FDW8_9BIFI|nr:hypothetical protein [Bifidobacterium angulatum]EEP21149.1 hypothetical protein BIFANG_02506 [Bifidobacterium angulatum DSM 20098 = JCM 7096]